MFTAVTNSLLQKKKKNNKCKSLHTHTHESFFFSPHGCLSPNRPRVTSDSTKLQLQLFNTQAFDPWPGVPTPLVMTFCHATVKERMGNGSSSSGYRDSLVFRESSSGKSLRTLIKRGCDAVGGGVGGEPRLRLPHPVGIRQREGSTSAGKAAA